MLTSQTDKTPLTGFLVYIIFFFFTCSLANAGIQFEEVTDTSGISHTSRSFGAAWGDFNNDGYADLYTNNHQSKPNLFLNQKDGTFIDIYDSIIGFNNIFPKADQHGSAWADFDNDGDQDLIVLVGGNGGGSTSPNNANHFYVNNGSILLESANTMGVDLPTARGRSPLWLDYDSDGLLDLGISNVVSSSTPITTLYGQQNNHFTDIGAAVGFQIAPGTPGLQLTDITNSGTPEIVALSSKYGFIAYDYQNIPFTDVTTTISSDPSRARGNGVIWADFNNDFLPDLFVPLGSKPSELTQVTPSEIHFGMFVSDNTKDLGFSFQSDSLTAFQLSAPWFKLTDVHIGAQNKQPLDWDFTLDPADSSYHGMPSYISGVDRGIFIGFDNATSLWTVVLNTDFVIPGALDSLLGIITNTMNISQLSAFGFNPVAQIWNNKLFINTGTDLVNMSSTWGAGEKLPSNAAVAGDFDNDMDLDLYVVNSLRTSNYPNRLYENTGSSFSIVSNAGGASGTNKGIGHNAIAADYDKDGFLDLYVMNGGFEPPFSDQGDHQLFRNLGNGNHWIEIDLEGITSNRDAVGTKVFLTAGGVTQWREQNGQMHNFSQDHKRLHFGLGANTSVDQLQITWPNGESQTLFDIPADQIIHISENISTTISGQPVYSSGAESGTFIWKEYFDGPYHLRTISKDNAQIFDIKLLSDAPLISVNRMIIENGDIFTTKANGFTYQRTSTSSLENGIDFELAPNAHALVSTYSNYEENPRNLFIGKNRQHIPHNGWIISTNELGPINDFTPGTSTVTRIGSNNSGNLSVRASANKFVHKWNYNILFENPPSLFDPIFLESGDSHQMQAHVLNIYSQVKAPWKDGFELNFPQNELLGIHLNQDGIFQAHPGIAKHPDGSDIRPNAYWLPVATPYGAPDYNAGDKAAVYVWKENTNGTWHLRFTAGGGSERFIGTITSTQPIATVSGFSLESSDTLNISPDAMTVDFSLQVANVWHDGIDLQINTGSSLQVNLTQGGNGAGSVFIGSQMLPISNLPIDLSGW